MRRLGSTFVTLWLTFFVPSLVIWGLMLRWSEPAATRFETIWRWSADHLAFPLLFSPLTKWFWFLLDQGTALGATSGFLILTAVWSLMLTLPLVFVGGWWVWIASRFSGAPAASGTTHFDSSGTASLSAGSSPLQSPLGAMYLLTIPIALLAAGLKRLFGTRSSFGWTLTVIPLIVFVVTAAIMALGYQDITNRERDQIQEVFVATIWYGYLDALRIPRIFHHEWMEAAAAINDSVNRANPTEWTAYMDQWYQHAELRSLLWITAARHALGIALLLIAIRLLGWIFRTGGAA